MISRTNFNLKDLRIHKGKKKKKMKKETIVRLHVEGLSEGDGYDYDIDFKIVAYHEDTGNFELESINPRHRPLGINWTAYPSSVKFID